MSLARRLGVRKSDFTLQSVACGACGHEWVHRLRQPPVVISEVDDMAELIAELLDAPPAESCPACGEASVQCHEGEHAYVCYSEVAAAHLAVVIDVQPSPGGGGLYMAQRVYEVSHAGAPREVEMDADTCVPFFVESALRVACATGDTSSVQGLATEVHDHAALRRLTLRELGRIHMANGHDGEAVHVFEQSLLADPEQADVLELAGRLHASHGNPGRATDLLVRAWSMSRDTRLLPLILRSTAQARRLGALRVAALELLEDDPQHLTALKAVVSTESATRVVVWRRSWAALAAAARAAGDAVAERVAACWLDALTLPIADWPDALDAPAYLELLAGDLTQAGCAVTRAPAPLRHEAALIPFDALVSDPDGQRWAVILVDALPRAHVTTTLTATLRALVEDPAHKDTRPLLLSREALPWWLLRYASDATDARLDLSLDADTSLHVHDENIATFLWLAERYFGALLDFSLESLLEVDRILLRYHEDGLGNARFPLVAVVTSYVAAVIERLMPGTRWEDRSGDMDPRTLVFPDGGELNLVSRIRRCLLTGAEDGTHALALALLDAVIGEPQGEA